MSKRIALSQEEAQWLYNIIQGHVMHSVMTGTATKESFQPFVPLIARIKHAAAN